MDTCLPKLHSKLVKQNFRMFPNQSHDSFFEVTSAISWPPNTDPEYQFTGDVSGESNGLIINTFGKGEQSLAPIVEENDDESSNKEKLKKVHKEIERKRRQEMATLHSSLRSLLPLEYIRGKRSISDHIHESVKYIKDLEKNIKELSMIKRDKLQMLSNSNVVSISSANSIYSSLKSVIISPCCVGFEILITSVLGEEVFPLSRVLQIMLEERFDVASYVSTQVNGRLFVSIKFEADTSRSIDLSFLQQKLADLIN